MSSFPDMKEIQSKLDSIVSNVKQMINPEDQMPHPQAGDNLGELIAECSALAHDLARDLEEYANNSEKLHIKLNQLFKDLREEPKVKEGKAKAEAEKPKAEEEKPKPEAAPEAEEKPPEKDA